MTMNITMKIKIHPHKKLLFFVCLCFVFDLSLSSFHCQHSFVQSDFANNSAPNTLPTITPAPTTLPTFIPTPAIHFCRWSTRPAISIHYCQYQAYLYSSGSGSVFCTDLFCSPATLPPDFIPD